MLFCHLLFFSNQFFRKFLSGIPPSECQTDWIQIRPDILSGLNWVQSEYKDYQQTTLVGNELTLFASRDFCHLLITFANSLDKDQDQQNPSPDLVSNCLTL